ncbi:MAG: glycosyltransferase family 2 protein [Patescibacteria group bacterium]
MKKSELKVSIIIPSYNTAWLLRKNLPKVLAAKENIKNNILEVIVVDDASPDESVKVLKEEFPEVRVIKHKENRGFSSTVNTGARSAKGELLALLNTDVIPDKDFLEEIIPYFIDENVYAVSMHEEGYGWAKGEFKDGFLVHGSGPEGKKSHITLWVSGGSGVFRRSQWMKLCGMDEKLFSPFYWEDVDMGYGAWKRGWSLHWEPKGLVTHKHETTMSKIPQTYRQRIQERNELIFSWKNFTSPILFRRHIVGLLKRLIKHPGYIRIVIMALAKIKPILKARAKEKRECKISDEAIFSRF